MTPGLPDTDGFVEKILAGMTLREKIGQCFTLGTMDGYLRPEVVEGIEKMNCAGIRLVPWERQGSSYAKDEDRCFKGGAIIGGQGRRGGSAVYRTGPQYAELLNQYQKIAISRPCGIPLHFSIDQEGDSYNDYTRGGVNLLPSNMGLAATGDPENAYRSYNAAGHNCGRWAHFIHSPVLAVNLNPLNPEMNFRAFSDDPQVVAEYGVQALRGLSDAGIIAVAKHFPGRGNSAEDAHYDLCVYRHDGKQMRDIDLLPYRALIENGLESIMIAHTVYRGLGDDDRPASVSPVVVTDLLRGEMGFEGVITTDSITMRGVMNKYGLAEACLRAFEAGNDLVLYRGYLEELPPAFDHIEKAVEDERMDVAVLDKAIARVLRTKIKLGLFDDPMIDLDKVEQPVRDPEIVALSRKLPAKTAIWMKKSGAMPLEGDRRVLLAEQTNRFAWQANDVWYHPGMMYEYMLELAGPGKIDIVECTMTGMHDLPRIKDRIDAADVVVATSYYCRTTEHNYKLMKEIAALGKPVIGITNQPFLCGKLMEICDSLLLIFSGNPPGLKAAADILYGKTEPGGTWPLKVYPRPRA